MRNKYSRGKRNKVSPDQREFFPKRQPSYEQSKLGKRKIAEIRERMGWK